MPVAAKSATAMVLGRVAATVPAQAVAARGTAARAAAAVVTWTGA